MLDTKWWTLIVTIVEVNMVNLAFGCAVQFTMPSFFCIKNKINFLSMVIFLFLLFIYSLAFYPLVQKYSHKKFSAVLLERSNVILVRSYRLEPIYFPFRNLIRSLVHGLLIENYKVQIVFLLFTDTFFTIFILRIRNIFKNKAVFLFSFLYSLIFILLDSLFVV